MRRMHAPRQKVCMFVVCFAVIGAFAFAACGTNGGGAAITAAKPAKPTPSASATVGTVRGFGATFGCPSDAVVSTSPVADVTVSPPQSNTPIHIHTGEVVEVQMPFGVTWRGPTASQGVLELQSPAGYAWKPGNACIWQFVARGTGTVVLLFTGLVICKKPALCVPAEQISMFTITVS